MTNDRRVNGMYTLVTLIFVIGSTLATSTINNTLKNPV